MKALVVAALTLTLCLAELALGRYVLESELVSALLSPGLHSSLWALAVGVTYLLLRLARLVLLPSVVVASAGYCAGSWFLRTRKPADSSPR